MKPWKLWDLSSAALTIPSAIAVGMFIGYWLDKALGTKPWLIIVFTLLGVSSGLLTFVRRALKYNREVEKDAAAGMSAGTRQDGSGGDPEG
jgi:ATP synthase protein I